VSEDRIRAAIAALAFVGVTITAYLTYVRVTGTTVACSTGGCETVQSSSYSEVLGIPVAVLGVVGYLLVLASALVRGELARTATLALGLAAFGFSGYLLVIQLAVIGAVCEWCVASDVVTTLIATLALLRFYAAERVAYG
jgi:uncharacterized membrane protein